MTPSQRYALPDMAVGLGVEIGRMRRVVVVEKRARPRGRAVFKAQRRGRVAEGAIVLRQWEKEMRTASDCEWLRSELFGPA